MTKKAVQQTPLYPILPAWAVTHPEGESWTLNSTDLQAYTKVDAERKVRPATDFTQEVLDHYLTGEKMTGVKLPIPELENRFRFRKEEVTLLSGINGSGKSLIASQWILGAMDQGNKCLSVSLEMSPKAQLARMWRQASLKVEPTLDFGIGFAYWARNKLWFFDQQGSVDVTTLIAVIRWAYENCGTDFVLVDSLMTMAIASDDYNGQKRCICALASVARELQIHILLVTHARKGKDKTIKEKLDKWSIRGASELADRADNIFLLGRTFDTDILSPDAYLLLAKARHFDGAECDMELWLDMASMNYHTANEEPQKLSMDDD